MNRLVSVLVYERHVRIGYWIGKLRERKQQCVFRSLRIIRRR